MQQLQSYAKIMPLMTFDPSDTPTAREVVLPSWIPRPVKIRGGGLNCQGIPVPAGNDGLWFLLLDTKGIFTANAGYPDTQTEEIDTLTTLSFLDLQPGSPRISQHMLPLPVIFDDTKGDKLYIDFPSNHTGSTIHQANPVVTIYFETEGSSPNPADDRVTQPFSETKLLLHFDGANNSTDFVDSSDYGFAVTAHGTARISTASPKFGSGSLIIDGAGGEAKVINVPSHVVGDNDFTVDFWVKPADVSAGFHGMFCLGGGYSSVLIGRDGNAAKFWSSSNGSTFDVSNGTGIGTLTAGTWTHIAVTRSGNTIYLFNNGTLINTISVSGALWNTGSSLCVGSQDGIWFAPGNYDEVRFINGAAAWTANFTPPTAAY